MDAKASEIYPKRTIESSSTSDPPARRTFERAFKEFLNSLRESGLSWKSIAQWQSSIETYVSPVIGGLGVAEIQHKQIVAVLAPIWNRKAETACRILQRLSRVFDAEIERGHRLAHNPCLNVRLALGAPVKTVEPLASLPHGEVGAFVLKLRESRSERITKLAFEMLILTAARSIEVREARKSELDLEAATWTIPIERMKGCRKKKLPHVIPLSARSIEICAEAIAHAPSSMWLFPSSRNEPLSDMTFTKVVRDLGLGDRADVHGFRSTFTAWCKDTDIPSPLCDAVLGRGKIESRRIAGKRVILKRWSEYVVAEALETPRQKLERLAHARSILAEHRRGYELDR